MKYNKKKKKKDDKILMLAKSKLNSIEALTSQALIDMDISHKEFITILKEKDKCEKMKENLRNENEKSNKIMRLSSVKSKTYKNKNKIKNMKNKKAIKNKKKFFWYNIKVKNY